jgi:hypothetical protein
LLEWHRFVADASGINAMIHPSAPIQRLNSRRRSAMRSGELKTQTCDLNFRAQER